MLTYQDFLAAPDRAAFLSELIRRHEGSELVRVARAADEYDRQRNLTIRAVTHTYIDAGGRAVEDDTASNNRLASNFFRRFVRQRVTYLLGNGVSFTQREDRINARGELYAADVVKERLGQYFDGDLFRWAYRAVLHGVCYGYWDGARLHVFPVTGFAPLVDEGTGALRAGLRYWRLDPQKPLIAELYEEAGRTEYRAPAGGNALAPVDDAPRPYRVRTASTPADGERVVGADNFSTLPVIPLYGSDQRQSALVGLRENIDAYDVIKSGFANTVADCAQVYWIIQNCGGMTPKDVKAFMDDLRYRHIAKVSTDSFDGTARDALTPYTQDPPHQANTALLEALEKSMYRDFGAVDVHAVSAGATNDHIAAAYQPLDEEADALEAEVISAVQQLLRLEGIEDTPQFKRNRLANLTETVNAVMNEARYLDEDAVLDLLPNVTVDMKEAILRRRAGETPAVLKPTRTPEAGESA